MTDFQAKVYRCCSWCDNYLDDSGKCLKCLLLVGLREDQQKIRDNSRIDEALDRAWESNNENREKRC